MDQYVAGPVGLEMMDDDDPYQTDERGIADLGPMLIAWFRDRTTR